MTRSLRPSGIGRYFVAVFLAAWLVGWAVGEAFALFAVGAILGAAGGAFQDRLPEWLLHPATAGVAALILLFLAVWLFFWTIGGFAALIHLVRSLWGEDVVAITPDGLELVRRGGPFRRRYPYDRAAIRRIRVRPHDKAVMIDAERGTRMLTNFGSPAERQELAAWLIRSLALPEGAAAAEVEGGRGCGLHASGARGDLPQRVDRPPRRADLPAPESLLEDGADVSRPGAARRRCRHRQRQRHLLPAAGQHSRREPHDRHADDRLVGGRRPRPLAGGAHGLPVRAAHVAPGRY